MTRTSDAVGLALNAPSSSFHHLQRLQNTRNSQYVAVGFEIGEQAGFLGTSSLQTPWEAGKLS